MGPTDPEISRQTDSTSTRPHVDRASNKTHGQPNYAQPGYYHGNSYPKPFHGSGYQANHPSQHDSFIDYGTGYVGKPAPRQNTYWQHDQSHQGKYYVQKSGSYQQYPSTKYVNKGNNHRYNPNKSFTAGMGETGQPYARRDYLSTAEDNRRSSGNNGYRGDGRYGQLQKSGNHQHYPSTKYANKSNNSRYNPNKSFTAGMGGTGQQNARPDSFSTTEDDRRSSGHNGSNNPEYQGYGKQNQIQKSENHQHYSSTKYANKSSEYIHNKSFTAGMGETGQPNARRGNFWNANSRHHNSKGFENQKNGANANRNRYRYNPNTSYARYTGAKRGPENVADHNTTVDLNDRGFESQHLNGDSFIQVFPSSTSSNLTDGQKLLQNLQNMESKVKLVDDSLMNQSFRGAQDQSCPQDSSILAVGPIFTPPRPVKYPYMFSPAVEKLLGSEQREKKVNKQVANADKEAKVKKDKSSKKKKIHFDDSFNMTIDGGERFVESPPPSKDLLNLTVGEEKPPRGILKKIRMARRSPPEFRSRSVSWGLVHAKSPDTPMYSPEGNLSDLNKSFIKPKSETSSEESSPSTPPKPLNKKLLILTTKPKSLPPPGWKTSCPVTFKKVVDHNENYNKAGCYMARGGICKFMPSVDITTDGLATFVNPETGRKIFMPLEFCFDIYPFIPTGEDEVPAGRYYYMADPKNDFAGQWKRELQEKHPELFNVPPHISNNVTGWEDLKAVVNEIAMKTCAPLPQLKSPSIDLGSKKAGSSIQNSATVVENTSDRKLAVVQEKKVEIPRKFILPPMSKGVKRTLPRFIHVSVEDWLNDTPAKTIDEKKMSQIDVVVENTQPSTPKLSSQEVIFTPLKTSTPRKTAALGSASRTSALVGELQATPKSWGNKNKLPPRRITIISSTLDDAELHNVKFLTPQGKKSPDDASSETTESPSTPSS